MNDNQNQNVQQQQYTNPQDIQAEVIGELRKDKIGKPILVVELFFLFGVILIALPIVHNLFNDESSFLYRMLHGNVVDPDTPVNPISTEYQDGSVTQTLDATTNMKYESIIMKNFLLKADKMEVTIQSYNEELHLDDADYFLNVYSSSEVLLASVKLTGTFDNQEQRVSLKAKDLAFNNSMGYVGKIVKFNDADYPRVDLVSDESGIGSLRCKMGDRSIEYIFKNNYLIGIKDEERVIRDNLENDKEYDQEYMNKLTTYKTKAGLLGANALVEEVSNGFKYSANINLEQIELPANIKDSNYYKADKEAKIIKFTQEGKGFDCGE